MPVLIEHIDAIARQKQRDVLYVVFHPPASGLLETEEVQGAEDFDWGKLPIRQQTINWMDAQGIGWKPCGPIANEQLMVGYRGQIYIDLPFEESLPAFRALQVFLELPDGLMRFPEVTLFYCPLDRAMENAAHDEPSFWQGWAEGL